MKLRAKPNGIVALIVIGLCVATPLFAQTTAETQSDPFAILGQAFGMFAILIWFGFFASWGGASIFVGWAARKHGYSGLGFFVLSILFSPLLVAVVVAGLPRGEG